MNTVINDKSHTFFPRQLIFFLRLKYTLTQGEKAKASIQLKGMLVVYLVSLSRAWTKVALGRSASGDTVLVSRAVPVASVHTSPSFSLGSSSQAWQSFPRLRWIRRMPEATSLLETTMSWTIKGCQQGESAAHAHTGESFVREMFFATITGDSGKGMQRTQTCSQSCCEFSR